ncbi:MAG: hypothetical protein H7Y37_12875 [Anaerolineae bacterium]|nr:hypothetical protein [Gloeobacterales cyanobacterium ES-bin-313]
MSAKILAPVCDGRLNFRLNRVLRVERLKVDGRTVETLDGDTSSTATQRVYTVPCPTRQVEVDYAGEGVLTKDGRNQISPELVELSVYGAWYPLLEGKLYYRVALELDEKFVVAANGTLVKERAGQGIARYSLRSEQPVSDIALVASPAFVRLLPAKATRFEALARSTLPQRSLAHARDAADAVERAAALYREWFGDTEVPVRASVAFSPRPGPLSYARLPLIVVPEAELANSTAQGYPYLPWLMGHEVGHFWWSYAEYTPADDWLNEGLAEYSAAQFVREVYGPDAYTALLKSYRQATAQAGESPAIVETPSDSSWIYANRYAKPALLLDTIERSVGTPRLRAFLAALNRRGASQRRLSRADFNETARTVFDRSNAERLAGCLTVRGWPAECGGQPRTAELSR